MLLHVHVFVISADLRNVCRQRGRAEARPYRMACLSRNGLCPDGVFAQKWVMLGWLVDGLAGGYCEGY